MSAIASSLVPRRPRILLALFFIFVVSLIFVASSRTDAESLRNWHIPTFTTDNDIVAEAEPKDDVTIVPGVKPAPEIKPGVVVNPDNDETEKGAGHVAETDVMVEDGAAKTDVKQGKPEDKSEQKPEDKVEEKPEAKPEEKPEDKVEEKPEEKSEEKPEDKTQDDAGNGEKSDGTATPETHGAVTPPSDDDSLNQDPVHISIIESDGVHDEVSAALITAFGGHPNAEMKLWFANQRYGMQDITDKFSLKTPIVSRNNSKAFAPAVADEPHPDIVILTTCEHDTIHMPSALRSLLANGTAHVFCTVHHADQWVKGHNVDVIREWAEKGQLDFITLSHHTADFLRNRTVSDWNDEFKVNIPIHVLPPVFNVELPEYDASKGISLAMQGDYTSARRDYKGIFSHLLEIIQVVKQASSDAGSVALRLIGHGNKPDVPEDVKEFVHFDSSLSYTQFYTLLSQAFSILPAFASTEYFDRKASSTVPAALIAGSPLVAGTQLLEAYTYYPREAAWVAEEGETEMDVMKRVITQNDEFLKKRQLIKETREKLIVDNQKNARDWVDELMKKQ